MQNPKTIIPIFFAVDDNYAPYLAVALRSLIDNASPDYQYNVHILIDKLGKESRDNLLAMARDNVTIDTINVKAKLDTLSDMLHLRDYYTKTTYYRFFIPALFPQYERGIYLDCDIVVTGDVSRLYSLPLGNNMLAAAPEEVMGMVDMFGTYVEAVLDIPRGEYFSAGILVMNLEKMRRVALEEQFVELLGRRTFRVTQDQDYLNVLCRGDVLLIDTSWNKTACREAGEAESVNIVHYKINWKPWHYKGVRFEKEFWHYADKTPYARYLYDQREGYDEDKKANDALQYENLVALAVSDTNRARMGILV